MIQQNQFPQINEGTLIELSTSNQPSRQFKILDLLGTGQEGAVYRAKASNWGQNQNEVAIKFSTYIKENVMWFYRQIIDYQNKYEIPNSSNYAPSNIIRIYDAFQWNNYYVLVMELGQTDLYKYLEQNQNKLTIQQKSSICQQILSSIVFIHSQKLFHRDIKPENYMMVDQQVKLIDFGLIKLQNGDQNRMTVSVGTKLFQAPELIQGKSDYTQAVDVWAMAFVFYEIIKGTQLLDVQTNLELEEIVKKHITNQSQIYNKIDELSISDEWKYTIKRMLHPDPNQRINVREAQERLSKNPILKLIIQNQNSASLPTNFMNKQMNTTNGQGIQQQSLQQLITQQLNALLIPFQTPNFNINQQQQKEQSIKLLCNLKDQIIKALNQLENNPIQVLSTNSSDSSQENQKQNQPVFRKELPPSIASKLNEIKKTIQEIEEKSISSQQEVEINDNLQKITSELEILKKNTQNFENKYQEYQQIQSTVESLKQKQKMLLQKEILEEYQKELQAQIRSISEATLKKENDNLQLQITKLEQQIITFNYYQDQKAKQQKIIADLQQQINNLFNLDQEARKQKDEILDLRIQLQFLESIKSEKDKNELQINQLKQEITKLSSYQAQFEQQKQDIQDLEQHLEQLQNIEADVKKQKEQIIQIKAKLRELPIEKSKLENQNKEIEKLKEDVKNLEQIQQKIDTLNQQIKELTQQKFLKLEKEEEEKRLIQEKDQQEKDLKRQTQTSRQASRI